jgi:hypothetical protein
MCTRPLKAYKSRHVNQETGKRQIAFNKTEGFVDQPLEISCGKCMECRLAKSREWAVRAMHEASLYTENCFITLTYNEESIPEDRSVRKEVFQKFMKRLRKEIQKNDPDRKIRYMACGEYGSSKNRPHYHAIIFNWDDPEKKLWTIRRGNPLYRSQLLERVWQYGYSSIGEVSFNTAAYVARYCTKKLTGEKAEKEYKLLDTETGEVIEIEPEFALISKGKNGKGLGYGWYQKYKGDTEKEFLTMNGHKVPIPEYYLRIMEKEEPERYKRYKINRAKGGNQEERKLNRKISREIVTESKNKLLIRSYEDI